MSQRKLDGIKVIANAYKIVKPLFQVKSYLYAQVCCLKKNYEIAHVALYVYQNEDPSQSLKMLGQKLDLSAKNEYSNLVFPYYHVKDSFNDKNISLFFMKDYLIPFRYYQKRPFTIQQYLQMIHGALSCLNHLHLRDIVHGNISLHTCYLTKEKNQNTCKFAFNLLDTTYFTQQDCTQGIEDRIFQSQGQSLGLKPSFKDDLESLVYVMTHLIAKGKMFTLQRFQLQWITQSEFSRWKSCQFFKEMVQIIPPELNILVEIYKIAKSLQRDQKTDYLKLIKKILTLLGSKDKNKINVTRYPHNKIEKQNNLQINHNQKGIKMEEIIVKVDLTGSRQMGTDKFKQNQSTFILSK